MSAPLIILCLNSGSSSLKFALYHYSEQEEALLASGAIERIGLANGRLWIRDAKQKVLTETDGDFPDHHTAVHASLCALEELPSPPPNAVGHRLVHGGPAHRAPELVTPHLLQILSQLVAFAPLHLPSEIQGIKAIMTLFPQLPQVVCFDTAFHARMPEIAQRFPLPRFVWDIGIRRYGFHGLSYEYIMSELGAAAQGRTIIAHLGNGASLAAVQAGKPLDTTMGLTPTGGVMMGTRSGDLDPGILLYLLQEKHYTAQQLDRLVNHEAGLLGVSEVSSDMKTLLAQRDRDPDAAQAVEMFCYQVRKHIGGLAAVLDGLDTLVFTGGMGERAAAVRSEVCAGLTYLGVQLDPQQNALHADPISFPQSPCTVRVIPTNEDLVIARHTRALISSSPSPSLVREGA